MMKIKPSGKFKADLKKFKHDQPTLKILDKILKLLTDGKSLPEKYRDHSLSGKWNPARECHIKPDVLLIYRINKASYEIEPVRLGSHSDLFK